jgi:hypothetical protein
MESEKTKAQKELIAELTERLQHLEHMRVYLTKYVMDDKNAEDFETFNKVAGVLGKLNEYLRTKRDELKAADKIWLGLQLDDLEAEICPVLQ